MAAHGGVRKLANPTLPANFPGVRIFVHDLFRKRIQCRICIDHPSHIPAHPKAIMIGGRKKSWSKEEERAPKNTELNPVMLGQRISSRDGQEGDWESWRCAITASGGLGSHGLFRCSCTSFSQLLDDTKGVRYQPRKKWLGPSDRRGLTLRLLPRSVSQSRGHSSPIRLLSCPWEMGRRDVNQT
jgi:hypothetical protein